jgi:PAS domain S-box-containing protein
MRERRWRGELRHRRKDDSELVVASKWTLSRAANGDAIVVEVSSDITALKRAEADQSRLAAIVESSDAAIIGKTLDGIVTSWNHAAEKIFGYGASEIIGKPISLISDARHGLEMREILERIKKGERIAHFETERRRKDGSPIAVSLSVSPIFDKNGAIVGASKIANDIGDRKARDDVMRAALKEKETLLREIHHRVKNNLQIIYSLLDLQAGAIRDPAALSLLTESKNRVLSISIIHQKLYESGNLAEVDFRAFVNDLAPVLASSYQVAANRVIVTVLAEDARLPINFAIPCGLILNELVSNAFKHAFPLGRRGAITIQLSRDKKNRAILSVSDDGVGIPEAASLTKSSSLGLRLVMLLAGQIRAEVMISNSGPTRFSFDFEVEP